MSATTAASAAVAIANNRKVENIFGELPEPNENDSYGLRHVIDMKDNGGNNNATHLNKLDDQIAKGMHDLDAVGTKNFIENIETFKNNINSSPASESVKILNNGMITPSTTGVQHRLNGGKSNGDVAIIDIIDEGE